MARWRVALATTVLCLVSRPTFSFAPSRLGFRPFYMTHRETVWWLAILLTTAAAYGSLVPARHWIWRKRWVTQRSHAVRLGVDSSRLDCFLLLRFALHSSDRFKSIAYMYRNPARLFLILVSGLHWATAAPPELHVAGIRLADKRGNTVHLQGVNIPSLEWSGTGEHVEESIDVAIGTWKANLIRLPLSQDRWFGKESPGKPGDAGVSHRALVGRLVNRIAALGSYVLLDLHWSDAGQWGEHVGQHSMPDDNSMAFWVDVAERFKGNPAVLFDLYNEPHDVSWEVWEKGGIVEEHNEDPSRGLHLRYHSPGMQALLDTVRASGARNVVVAGGLDWAYDLRGVVQGHALHDPKGNGVLYGTHIYPWKKDWDKHVTLAIGRVPVFVGEVGTKPWKSGDPAHENVYTPEWAGKVLTYIQTNRLDWTAWSLHPSASPSLISDWNYTPSDYWGRQVKAVLTGSPPPR